MNSHSFLLLLGAANGFVLAGVLGFTRRDAATRMLAALVAIVSLRLMPYVLGYAGMYDAHRWLTFAPFDLSLAMGPLLWGYVVALTTGSPPRRWSLHLAPSAAQLAYLLVCFALPLDAKWDWFTGPHLHAIDPALVAATLLSLAAYLGAAWMRYAGYQTWLAENVSNREELRMPALRGVLLAFAATLLVSAGFAVVGWIVTPLDYFDRFPLMVWLAALVYFLGLAGWRQAGVSPPHLQPSTDPEPPVAAAPVAAALASPGEPAHVVAMDEPVAAFGSVAADEEDGTRAAMAAQAAEHVERLRAAGWWRDEGLTLAALAKHLRTSPRTLSRVLNEGLGQGFNEVVNRLRVDAVRAELADPASRRDLLVIALDAGFSSKASFNRAFKLYAGCTPSELRERERLNARQIAPATEFATRGAGD